METCTTKGTTVFGNICMISCKIKFLLLPVAEFYRNRCQRGKLNAGASLVRMWTGFIYEGPAIVKNKELVVNNFLLC